MYGQRKPIAQRTPLSSMTHRKCASSESSLPGIVSEVDSPDLLSTPPATEGESATETDFDLETEFESCPETTARTTTKTTTRIAPKIIFPASPSSRSLGGSPRSGSPRLMSQHDLLNKYFRRDAVLLLRNVDVLRLALHFDLFVQIR